MSQQRQCDDANDLFTMRAAKPRKIVKPVAIMIFAPSVVWLGRFIPGGLNVSASLC